MITAAGAGSGIDVESIVSQLMSLEQRPIFALQERQSALDVELSDVGKLQSSLASLKSVSEKMADPDYFGAWDIASADEDIVTVDSSQGQVAENHSIEITAIATAHRLRSTAYTSETTNLTPGQFDFSSGDESFSVVLDAGASTLLDLRDAINDSVDNTTIQASVLNTNDGSHLVLTATNTGTANQITAPAEFSELTAAVDAELTIDGLAVTSSSNTLTKEIPGITIDVLSIGTTNIESVRNIESIKNLFEEFAEAYNSLNSTLGTLGQGSLQGDGMLRQVENSLRNEFFAPIVVSDDSTMSIFDFGLTFDKTGILSVDAEKLNSAVSNSVSQTLNAFSTDESGFGDRITAAIDRFIQSDGYIDNRENAINARNRSIDLQIDRLDSRMDQIETRYRRQFSAMDSMIAQLQTSGDYLLSSLASLE